MFLLFDDKVSDGIPSLLEGIHGKGSLGGFLLLVGEDDDLRRQEEGGEEEEGYEIMRIKSGLHDRNGGSILVW